MTIWIITALNCRILSAILRANFLFSFSPLTPKFLAGNEGSSFFELTVQASFPSSPKFRLLIPLCLPVVIYQGMQV